MSINSTNNPFSLGIKYNDIEEQILKPVESFPTRLWWIVFGISSSFALLFLFLLGLLFTDGLGILGINKTVGWGILIVDFVFWVGIGHAGTLISAILYLFRQRWRTTINRAAEAMTIFAVLTALMHIMAHLGRVWFFFWTVPYPNERGPLWVNFNSPLFWDVLAISTYFIISLAFWYMGLVPDFAIMRDRKEKDEPKNEIHAFFRKMRKQVVTFLSLGWVGSAKSWLHYEKMVLMLAALATPLVLSVHTIVSFDFATSVIPGWHATIFPPYFVDGAIYSGFAMVLSLMIISRKLFHLEAYITMKHLENMAYIILVTGLIVSFAYTTEFVMAAYSAWDAEQYVFLNRLKGPFSVAFWTMFTCNVVAPHFLWFKRVRKSVVLLFCVSIIVNVGMWFERYVIVVTSLSRDYLPSSWQEYTPTWVEWGLFLGSFGFFFTLYLLFVRLLPSIAIMEVKADEAGDEIAKGFNHH